MTLRVVVVGSGSAGRRHATAIRNRCSDADLVVVRRPESVQPVAPFSEIGATLVPSLDAALAERPSIAVVASPATLHRADAERLLEADAAVLIEKPLAASLDDGRAIAAAGDDAAVVVGYHLRRSHTVVAFRSLLHRGVVGEPLEFDLRVGQHLGQWRTGVDPRLGVSARRELGGGVLLELSHELDAVLHLFGPVARVRAALAVDGAPTDGLVETVADLELSLSDGVTGRVHLDMVSEPATRIWTARGADGELRADLLRGTIELCAEGTTSTVHRGPSDERDRAEAALIENLWQVAAGEAPPMCTVDEGLDVLTVVEAARRSAEIGEPVDIGDPSDRVLRVAGAAP